MSLKECQSRCVEENASAVNVMGTFCYCSFSGCAVKSGIHKGRYITNYDLYSTCFFPNKTPSQSCQEKCNCGKATNNPWHVFLKEEKGDERGCNGAVISDTWILTAASCSFVKDYSDNGNAEIPKVQVVANPAKPVKVGTISQIKVMIDAVIGDNFMESNFALLKTETKMKDIHPVCLPSTDIFSPEDETYWKTYWKKEKDKADTLMKSKVILNLDEDSCSEKMNNEMELYGTQDMICGLDNELKDEGDGGEDGDAVGDYGDKGDDGDDGETCLDTPYADTPGSTLIKTKSGDGPTSELVGVMAYDGLCQKKGQPEIYGSVFAISSWIYETIGITEGECPIKGT